MTFRTSHLLEVTRWVLSWGAAATALGPAELVRAVKAEIGDMRRNYGRAPASKRH
jgi:predicted DNA-binding transcriptional regulator YafY